MFARVEFGNGPVSTNFNGTPSSDYSNKDWPICFVVDKDKVIRRKQVEIGAVTGQTIQLNLVLSLGLR